MAYRVLIVEDQDMPRQLFEIFVNSSDHFQHLLSITNSASAISICQSQQVDLILMDVLTELGHSGLEAAEEIKKRFPSIKIIIVTSMPEYSWLKRAKQIGVDSFWYKDGQKDSILDVMERTMAGERIYPDETPLVRIGNTENHEFTERELDILKELTSGDSNAVIGERLHISAGTVKSHVQHLLDKTGFKTRTELASEARSLGIAIRKNEKWGRIRVKKSFFTLGICGFRCSSKQRFRQSLNQPKFMNKESLLTQAMGEYYEKTNEAFCDRIPDLCDLYDHPCRKDLRRNGSGRCVERCAGTENHPAAG